MKTKHDEQIQKLAEEANEWKTKYLRALADYQNLEKYTRTQLAETRKYASESMILDMLPVIDSLELAAQHVHDKGLDLVIGQFHEQLRKREVYSLEVVGKPFDPLEMECIEVSEGEENIVLQNLRTGYRMGDKIIRPARVRVGKNVQNNTKSPSDVSTLQADGSTHKK